MANLKISQLTAGNPAQAGDLFPIDRAGANFKVTAASIAALAGGGSNVGMNMVALPKFISTDSGDSNLSFILCIHASQVIGLGNSLKLRFDTLAGGTTTLNAAVVRRTLPNSIVWLDSTPITWGGSATPTFAASSQNLSDAVVVPIDSGHDFYIICSVGTATGATFPAITTPAAFGLYNTGYLSGNQTATADASTFATPSGLLQALAQVTIGS